MRRRDIAAGLVVLGVIAAGVLLARWRSATPAVNGEAPPDITFAAAAADEGGVRITLSLSPNPPVAYAKTHVRVRAESGGSTVMLNGGRVSFEMSMPMGEHRYSLVPGADGWQEADVTLPLCPSGKRRWYATVEGSVAGRPRTARFRFELAPPT